MVTSSEHTHKLLGPPSYHHILSFECLKKYISKPGVMNQNLAGMTSNQPRHMYEPAPYSGTAPTYHLFSQSLAWEADTFHVLHARGAATRSAFWAPHNSQRPPCRSTTARWKSRGVIKQLRHKALLPLAQLSTIQTGNVLQTCINACGHQPLPPFLHVPVYRT